MIGPIRQLVRGQDLRHRPVALASADQRPVRAIATSPAGERDVSRVLFPVSLKPLVLGVGRGRGEPIFEPTELRMHDAAGDHLGSIRLAPAGIVEHPDGFIDLYRPTGSSVRCVSVLYRAWRYATAWRHMRIDAKRPQAFHMDFAGLRALNVLYMMPRPVYLVTVLHQDWGNVFPMDLVGPLGDDLFVLALRKTSVSIEPMRAGKRIALSAMPAQFKDVVYRLGAHHRAPSIDREALELATMPSPLFGFPVASEALSIRELNVRHSEVIGSHVLFVASVAHFSVRSDEPQFCHVSDMYARWRARCGAPFIDA